MVTAWKVPAFSRSFLSLPIKGTDAYRPHRPSQVGPPGWPLMLGRGSSGSEEKLVMYAWFPPRGAAGVSPAQV